MEKKISWPYDEYDAELSPEHEELWAEIAGELRYRKRLSMTERDRLLRDYRAAFGGIRDEDGSVLDGPIPQSYIDRWYAIHGKESNYKGQTKEQKYADVAGGISIAGGSHAITCFQGRGNITLGSKAAAQAFVASMQEAIAGMEDDPVAVSPAVSTASSARSFSQNERLIQSSEARKQRFEQNMREAERFARQSAFSYPRYG